MILLMILWEPLPSDQDHDHDHDHDQEQESVPDPPASFLALRDALL
jgi:hypothetical protein